MDKHENIIGKKCIIRCNRAGVFFGKVASLEGQEAELHDVRRLWKWVGATDCLQLAAEGVKEPGQCMFTVSVSQLVVTDAIEVIPCRDEAVRSIEGVKVWKI